MNLVLRRASRGAVWFAIYIRGRPFRSFDLTFKSQRSSYAILRVYGWPCGDCALC
jgi:hypothetical protein